MLWQPKLQTFFDIVLIFEFIRVEVKKLRKTTNSYNNRQMHAQTGKKKPRD